MAAEMITKEDLQEFRMQLISDIKRLLETLAPKKPKHWLKNSEVRKLMGVSPNTVRTLRMAGKLRYSKVGGIYYYRYDDIEKLMDDK